MKRIEAKIEEGLTKQQVEQRKQEGFVNKDTTIPTKSFKQIVKENFVTLFNIINLVLGIIVFCVGSYKNTLFLLVVIANTAISTLQEIHSKRIIDKLSVLAESKVKVIRDKQKQDIAITEVVLDDIIQLETGNQVVTDSILCEGEVEVDESFITGESETVFKKKGDVLLSGSFIVSGNCFTRVEHIGEDNYTAKISSGAKYVKKVNSEIMTSLNKIVKTISYTIIPVGIILFLNQLQLVQNGYPEAVVKTVAAIIGMIPEGLVLLTSTVLAISVIRLSKTKVLVQQLYCIETLARVDTLCLDKTGTLTEGKMEVKKILPINKEENIQKVIYNIAKFSRDNNSTINAIREYKIEEKESWTPKKIVDFSSKTKWSGITFEGQGSYIIGAPEFIAKKEIEKVKPYSGEYRVIAVCHSKQELERELPEQIELVGLILIKDKIRKEAAKTLAYFKEQEVDIKIISGDNPETVSQIAKEVGLEKYNSYIDMSTIQEEEIPDICLKYTIFGRVSSLQKKELVKAMKQKDRTVAMTGDGVNDVLALKEADCSIAMANGSDATKSVSELILLDSNFASMPKVVGEGRRTINNIGRSASLFLVKTIYSCVLAILFIFIATEYPFMPIQLSLISTITIGIPSFLLALEKNNEKISGVFLKNVIEKAIPTALTIIIGILAICVGMKIGVIPEEAYSTLCLISTGLSAIFLLFTLSKSRKSEKSKLPVSPFRITLSILLTLIFFGALILFPEFLSVIPLGSVLKEIIVVVSINIIVFTILNLISKKIFGK